MTAHCHKQVREVARAICGELYETLMGQNEFYQEWRRQNPGASAAELEKRFVNKNWGQCIKMARETLAKMLTDPTVTDRMKMDVVDVLAKDQSLTRGRTRLAN